jgi:large conductance mechanosensitive channel
MVLLIFCVKIPCMKPLKNIAGAAGKSRGFVQEFKEFAMKGNVMDLAIGIIIGAAFGKIVSSLVADVIMPIIGTLVGGVTFTDIVITLKQAVGDTPAVVLNIGTFIQTVFDFAIIAFAIFMMIKALNRMKKKEEAKTAEPAATPEDIALLREIRDALKK